MSQGEPRREMVNRAKKRSLTPSHRRTSLRDDHGVNGRKRRVKKVTTGQTTRERKTEVVLMNLKTDKTEIEERVIRKVILRVSREMMKKLKILKVVRVKM